MRLAPYWASASVDADGNDAPGPFAAYGWSTESLDAARAHALQRAQGIVERWRSDTFEPEDMGRYYADGRPPREPIVERMERDGLLVGALTTNAYGATILNTHDLVFIDVDQPYRIELPGCWASLWGARTRQLPTATIDELLDRVRQVAATHPALSLRAYQTAGGLRVMLTNTPMPVGVESLTLLEAFGADPLYVKLCMHQECYRARLTPKPWRMAMSPPALYYPWEDHPERREAFAAWRAAYDQARSGKAVCHERARFGPDEVHPDLAELVALHDRWCVVPGPLA